jgi:hypothetical protein
VCFSFTLKFGFIFEKWASSKARLSSPSSGHVNPAQQHWQQQQQQQQQQPGK